MPGYTIDQLVDGGPLSRNEIYDAIEDGSLVARKRGKRTIVLGLDWENFLNALPRLGIDVPKVEPEALRGSDKSGRSKKAETLEEQNE
jgi:hypothetical protein